jgi:hypothetical protein
MKSTPNIALAAVLNLSLLSDMVKNGASVQNLPQNSLSRRFLNYSSKRAQELLALTKSELKTITGILTGHNGLNYTVNIFRMDSNQIHLSWSPSEYRLSEFSNLSNFELNMIDYG